MLNAFRQSEELNTGILPHPQNRAGSAQRLSAIRGIKQIARQYRESAATVLNAFRQSEELNLKGGFYMADGDYVLNAFRQSEELNDEERLVPLHQLKVLNAFRQSEELNLLSGL
ncbi:MAG: hypothetical protein HLUCCO16_08735 [Phormidium sp. OSCR]|nr:MAG: hypothetical protein HLUCCO16_08735 [Phormidium sp. OSCR]